MTGVRMITGRHGPDVTGEAQLYETPQQAVRALCRADNWLRGGPRVLWDPACGPGAIVAALQAEGHDARGSDLYAYGARWKGDMALRRPRWRIDFLKTTRRQAGPMEAVVMNPPYGRGPDGVPRTETFLLHPMSLVPRVYCLLELGWLQGQSAARDSLLDSPHWLAFYPFRERLDMNRDGWDGPNAASTRKHAWFVFGREARPEGPHVRRLSILEGA